MTTDDEITSCAQAILKIWFGPDSCQAAASAATGRCDDIGIAFIDIDLFSLFSSIFQVVNSAILDPIF